MPPTSNAPPAVLQFRCRNGLCFACGTAIFDITTQTALTVPGVVLAGRCLFCYGDKGKTASVSPPDATPAAAPPRQEEVNAHDNPADLVPSSLAVVSPPTTRRRTRDNCELEESLPINLSRDTEMEACNNNPGDDNCPPRKRRATLPSTEPVVDISNDDTLEVAGGNLFEKASEDEEDTKMVASTRVCSSGTQSEASVASGQSTGGCAAGGSRVVTPGFQRIDDENESNSIITLCDYNELEYKGRVTKGDAAKGYGRFEHLHKSLDDASDGDVVGKVSIYHGEFDLGKFEGKGKLRHACGSVYEGEFHDGAPHGQGKCVWPGIGYYEGAWIEDRRDGKGKFVQPVSGEEKPQIYEGEWKADMFDGHGELKFAEGGRRVGHFREGLAHGHGRSEWKSGEVYVGNYKDDVRSGNGKMTYTDGCEYDGKWKDNERSEGELVFPDGRRFNGNFKGDSMLRGVMTFPDGKMFDGWFNDDYIWRGTLTLQDGTMKNYKNGKLQRPP